MRKGKSGIPKRASGTPGEPEGKRLRIPIKKLTAENIMAMNAAVGQKLEELKDAQANLQNHVLPLLTERGVPHTAILFQVTEKPPYELIVLVPKAKR